MKKVVSFVLACAMVLGLVSVLTVPQAQAITLEDANVATFEDDTAIAQKSQCEFTPGAEYGTFTPQDPGGSPADTWVRFNLKATKVSETPYLAIRYKGVDAGERSRQDWIYPVAEGKAAPKAGFIANDMRDHYDGEWRTLILKLPDALTHRVDLDAIATNPINENDMLTGVQMSPPNWVSGKNAYLQIAWVGAFKTEEDVHTYETLFENRGKITPKEYWMVPSDGADQPGNAWVLNPNEYVGVRFKTKAAFTAVKVGEWTPTNEGNNPGAKWTLSVYAWNTDYATSVAGTAVATASGTSTANDPNYEITLDQTVPAGEYVMVLTGLTRNEPRDGIHLFTYALPANRADLFETFTSTEKYHSEPDRFPGFRLIADSSAGDELFEALSKGGTTPPAETVKYVDFDAYPGTKNNYWDDLWVDLNGDGKVSNMYGEDPANPGTWFKPGDPQFDPECVANTRNTEPSAPFQYVGSGIDNTAGTYKVIKVRGWVYFDQEITEMGYSIDNGPMVAYSDAFVEAPDTGILQLSPYGKRFNIIIPLSELTGEHTIVVVAKLADGTLVKINRSDSSGQHNLTIPVKCPEKPTVTGDASMIGFVAAAIVLMGAVCVLHRKKAQI